MVGARNARCQTTCHASVRGANVRFYTLDHLHVVRKLWLCIPLIICYLIVSIGPGYRVAEYSAIVDRGPYLLKSGLCAHLDADIGPYIGPGEPMFSPSDQPGCRNFLYFRDGAVKL